MRDADRVRLPAPDDGRALDLAHRGAFPRTEARLWMAVTLTGVLLACLAALILTPLRAMVSEE